MKRANLTANNSLFQWLRRVGFGLLIIAACLTAHAQAATFTVAVPEAIELVEWAPDSSGVVGRTDTGSWMRVDINAHEVSESPTYPLQPQLSDTEREVFRTEGVIRTSPDGVLLLYVVREVSADGFPRFNYLLANRRTREIVNTSVPGSEANVGPFLDVMWSADGSAVAIGTLSLSGLQKTYHITIPDRDDLSTIIVQEFDIELNGQRLYTFDPYMNHLLDISDAGDNVLLTAQVDMPDIDPYGEATVLVWWTPAMPEVSRVLYIEHLDARWIRAAFAPGSSDEILIFSRPIQATPTGRLYLYNLIQNDLRSVTLPAEMTFMQVMFSPNGEWIIYGSPAGMVFLPIANLLVGEQIVLTPSYTPSQRPTRTWTPTPTATRAAH
jgi:hypothetical protein